MTSNENILIIGAGGQIGADLVIRLRSELTSDSIIATDVKEIESGELRDGGPFYTLDVLDYNSVARIIDKYKISNTIII